MDQPIILPVVNADLAPMVGETFVKGGKTYKIVKASGAIAANDVVVYSGTDGSTVATTTSAAVTLIAGVAEAAIADGAYGYIVVKGVTTAKVKGAAAAGEITAGMYLTTTTTAGKVLASATFTQLIALEGTTTDTTKLVLVNA